jgi:hypothetical protein
VKGRFILGMFKFILPKNDKSLFLSTLVSMILGLVTVFIIYKFFNNGEQIYHDIVVGNITWEDVYKDIDYKAIYGYFVAFFISLIGSFQVFNRFNYRTDSNCQHYNSIFLMLVSLFFYCLMIWFVRGGVPKTELFLSSFISLVGLFFISNTNEWNGKKDETLNKEMKQKFTMILLSCLFLYFSYIGAVTFAAFIFPNKMYVNLLEMKLVTNLVIYTIIFLLVILVYYIKRISLFLIGKILLASQITLPLLQLIMLKNQYVQDNKIITPFEFPFLTKTLILTSVVGSIIYAIYKLFYSKQGNVSNYIIITTIISISTFVAYNKPVYSTFVKDDFHLGELLIPWQQIVGFNQVLFHEFVSIQGVMGLMLGWINEFLLDGSYASFMYSFTYLDVFFTVIISLIVFRLAGVRGLIIILFGLNIMDRYLLAIATLLLLADYKLWRKPFYWLILWNILSLLNVLYIPAIGAAQVIATLPFAIFACYRFVAEKSINFKTKLSSFLGLLTFDIVLAILLFPTIMGVIKFILDNGATNTVGYGKTLFNNLKSPSWFSSPEYQFLHEIIWNTLRVGGWIFGVSIILYYAIKQIRITKGKEFLLQHSYTSIYLPVTSVIFILLLIPYSMGRIDQGVSRTGSVTLLVLGTLLPLLLVIRFNKEKARLRNSILLGVILGYSSAVSYQDMGLFYNKAIDPIVVPSDEKLFNGKDYDLNHLGTIYSKESRIEELKNLQTILGEFLEQSETYYDFTNRSSLYYLLDKKVPVPYSADYVAMNYNQQSKIITILNDNPPPLVFLGPNIRHDGGPASLRSYRVYRFFINEGYKYYEESGLSFLVRSDRFNKLIESNEQTDLFEKQKKREIFHVKDLKSIPVAWGRNFKNLESRFQKGDIKLDLLKVNQIKNEIDSFIITNSQDPYIVWNIEGTVDGSSYDYLKVNITTNGSEKEKLRGQIFWATNNRDFDEDFSFKFNITREALLIPMGSHPDWLKEEISKIRIDFDESEIGSEVRIGKIEFLKLVK